MRTEFQRGLSWCCGKFHDGNQLYYKALFVRGYDEGFPARELGLMTGMVEHGGVWCSTQLSGAGT